MDHMDANKTHREKAGWELHKNAKSYFEQILREPTALRPLTFHLKNQDEQDMRDGAREKKEELISDVLLGSITHGRGIVGWLVRTYLHQLDANAECRLEDLPGGIDDRDEWREGGDPCCHGGLMIRMKWQNLSRQ